jgi:type I restriction enzyme S subunit
MSFDLPTLPDDWVYAPLDSCCQPGSVTYGIVQPGAPVSEGVPIVRVNNFRDMHLDLSDVMRVAPEVEAKYGRTRLKGGEVLLTIVGSVGQVAVVPQHLAGFNVARAVAVMAPLAHVSPDWIALCLRSPLSQHLLGSRANTTVQTTINLKDLRALPVPLPPVHERRLIAALIGALDDRITHLRETNATLEAIAHALFKSWFVDFDPVRAKQAGLAPEGMDEATAALFPSAFEEIALGLVPKGWALTPFGQLLTRTIGGDWGSDVPDEKNDTRVAIVRGTDIPDLQTGAASRVPIRYTSLKKLASRRIEEGDIVLEVSGGSKDQPTGRALFLTKGLLHQFDCPVEPASFCRLLRPANKDLGILLSQHLSFIYAEGKTWEYQNQSTGIANFQTTHFLEKELVVLPSQDVLAAFADLVRPLIERTHVSQIRELTGIRDTLLPRLISGRLRLPEAQHQIEEVTA